MTPDGSDRWDRLAIVILCGVALIILGLVSGGAIFRNIPNDSQTLLGVIVGGVLLFARECLQAIRAFAQDSKTGKLTDQLANSTQTPAGTPEDPMTIQGTPDAPPVPVTDR